MGILRETNGNGRADDEAAPPLAQTETPSAPDWLSRPHPGGELELRTRRDALQQEVAELHWDLGGLAYEMAIRDHFRLDVLVRRAAVLQDRDAELAEIERLLRAQDEGTAGRCPSCAAPHSRGALFCWQCGTTLMEQRVVSAALASTGAPNAAGAEEQRTEVVHDGERRAAAQD